MIVRLQNGVTRELAIASELAVHRWTFPPNGMFGLLV